MVKTLSALGAIAAALIAAPAAAQGDFGNPALTQTPVTTAEIARSYSDTDETWQEATIRRLNTLCRSTRAGDRADCAKARAFIVRRTAELAAAGTGER